MTKNFNNKYFNLFCSVLSQAKYGKIKVFNKKHLLFEQNGLKSGPNVKIQIHDFKCVSNFFLKGDLGWAESYIDNMWDTEDLTGFLEWGALNFHCFSDFIRGKWYIILFLRFKHFLNSNSKKGSRKNISFHYDLGNEFYKHWLDKSMTYSSAIFSNKSQKLYDAQINKFNNLVSLCDIKSNDSVLEVGCGWGSFSIYLAKIVKARVTAITISKKQFELVRKRILDENLSDRIDVKLLDYRDLKGKFDKIVSIEMFEAVGEKYWSLFFRILKKNLKIGGKIGLQTITIKDNYFLSYKKFPDFIQTYIFPGGMLPSLYSLNKTLDSEGLRILKENLFGQHYAKTINVWRRSFDSSWIDIKKSGFDISFKRLWSYYLSYCEGGFKSGNINVGQFLIGRAK